MVVGEIVRYIVSLPVSNGNEIENTLCGRNSLSSTYDVESNLIILSVQYNSNRLVDF